MLFLVRARFRPGAEAERNAIHERFNAHLAQHTPRVRLGASMRDDGGGRLGVMLLVEAPERADAERFVKASPYTEAGLYDEITIERLEVEVGSLG